MEKDLISMGYRLTTKDTYLKPIGYLICSFNTNILIWKCHFKNDNEHVLYSTVKYNEFEQSFISFIKDCETLHILKDYISESNYEFLTLKDQMEIQL